ncbi:MAG TPA: response regulator [Geobacteraceae bacterium]|nr:response regulator [Geobacteraceae bacterium]
MNHGILLVDDEPNVISALERALLDEPYTIYNAESGEEGLERLSQVKVKVIVSDERMPGMGGAEFLSRVKELHPQVVRIMLTGQASVESTMKAVNKGEIYRFLIKPWDDSELILSLRSAVEKYDMEEENRRLLRTVKRQSQEIRMLEKRFPGISAMHKDDSGTFILPDISDDELEKIIAAYCEES